MPRRAVKFMDLKFLYISKVLETRDKIKSKKLLEKEKISVQQLHNTANLNNSVIISDS